MDQFEYFLRQNIKKTEIRLPLPEIHIKSITGNNETKFTFKTPLLILTITECVQGSKLTVCMYVRKSPKL